MVDVSLPADLQNLKFEWYMNCVEKTLDIIEKATEVWGEVTFEIKIWRCQCTGFFLVRNKLKDFEALSWISEKSPR